MAPVIGPSRLTVKEEINSHVYSFILVVLVVHLCLTQGFDGYGVVASTPSVHLHPTFSRAYTTMPNKLLSGPLIVKTDSGPGRLSKEADSLDFREQLAAMGVHILLSLPNATSCTAEMDQLFIKFKPACSKSALRVASKKIGFYSGHFTRLSKQCQIWQLHQNFK